MNFFRNKFLEINYISLLFIIFIGTTIINKNVYLGIFIPFIINTIFVYMAYKLNIKIIRVVLVQLFSLLVILIYAFEYTNNVIFVYFSIVINIILAILLFIRFRKKISGWFGYLGIFVSSVILSSFAFVFSIIMLQSALGVSDQLAIALVYFIAVILPIMFIVLEKDEKQISEIKVGIYAWIALITCAGALSFLYQTKIETYVIDEVLNVQSDLDQFKEIMKTEDLEKIEEELKKLDVEYEINGEYLEIDAIIENIEEKATHETKEFVDFLIKILFLPHILGGTIGAFFVEWKEKRMKYRTLGKKLGDEGEES